MDDFIKGLKFSCLLLFILISFSFFSCAQNVPELVDSDCTVIFTYYDYNSLPDARLGVFLQSQSDVRRCERIKLKSLESEYIWETGNLKRFADGELMWAGNVNFVVPEFEKIPAGMYEIAYVNADGENDVIYTEVRYDVSFYDNKAGNVSSAMENKGILNIAIYDSNDVMIYFGEKTEEFKSKNDILSMYNSAMYYKNVWVARDGSFMCILPPENL